MLVNLRIKNSSHPILYIFDKTRIRNEVKKKGRGVIDLRLRSEAFGQSA